MAALATTPIRSALGDGNDIINELANNGGRADRISILARIDTDPVTLLPADGAQRRRQQHCHDNRRPRHQVQSRATRTQNITVAGHFTGTNAQTGVERINFNSATYAGYLLGLEDYLVSRADPNNRDSRRRQSLGVHREQLHRRRERA